MTPLRPLGSSARNQWRVDETQVDFIRPRCPPRPLALAAAPQDIRLDLSATALVIIDMQNDFCHPDGWLASIGVDITPARTPIAPLTRIRRLCRARGVPVIWVNWGNRPDRLNLGPSTLHTYDGAALGRGVGTCLPNGARILEQGSWCTAIVDEFGDTSADVHVAKYAMSGFWDTPLDAILRNLGVTTLLFGGVNLDQCVLCTLQDASFRGYDCVLLEDCAATTSPSCCTEATLYNVRQCFGFTALGATLMAQLQATT
ncbi:cysteine hydrolase family protein [Gluconacetobacter sacchari]|uniref:cysteine hydrolase family protein n=1 Tax=Gluconacetobacter sacchari TaxID=92759 RepID=UPI0039B586A7